MQSALASKLFGERSNRFLSSRRGTVVLGATAALLAALMLLAYLNQYRNSVGAANRPSPVLIANRLIPKGTSATIMAGQGLFQLATIPQKHLKAGAVADPATLQGRVATRDLAPGQQLTLADFSTTMTDAIPTRITGAERAVSVTVDISNGMVGHIAAGDRVDVYVAMDAGVGGLNIPVVKLLLPDTLVLASPAGAGGGIGGGAPQSYVLRVASKDAGRLAFAVEHGRIWIVARPGSGAKPSSTSLVTANNVIFGRR